MFVVTIYPPVVRITSPAKLGTEIEVEDFEMVSLGVNEEIPHANVAVNNSQSEVEVVDSLKRLFLVSGRCRLGVRIDEPLLVA